MPLAERKPNIVIYLPLPVGEAPKRRLRWPRILALAAAGFALTVILEAAVWLFLLR